MSRAVVFPPPYTSDQPVGEVVNAGGGGRFKAQRSMSRFVLHCEHSIFRQGTAVGRLLEGGGWIDRPAVAPHLLVLA